MCLVDRTTLTAAQRSLRARIGAFALHAQGGTSTRAGTAAFLSRFETAVDPAGSLSPEERAKRATQARKAYFAKLALASSRARSQKKAGPDRDSGPAEGARQVDAEHQATA
jgi:hypothetical protein